MNDVVKLSPWCGPSSITGTWTDTYPQRGSVGIYVNTPIVSFTIAKDQDGNDASTASYNVPVSWYVNKALGSLGLKHDVSPTVGLSDQGPSYSVPLGVLGLGESFQVDPKSGESFSTLDVQVGTPWFGFTFSVDSRNSPNALLSGGNKIWETEVFDTSNPGSHSGALKVVQNVFGSEWSGRYIEIYCIDGQGNRISDVKTYKLDPNSQQYWASGIAPTKCFSSCTRILTSRTTSIAISALRVGDVVLAYDASADKGRGALVPRRVTRLYRNTTTEWIRLRWQQDGVERELVTTPGHHFLSEFGHFPRIDEMVKAGRTTVVLASGALTEVTAERILYSAETAHMFERATSVGMIAGNAALQPVEIDAWQTYNIEVEDLHTYVAEGVRRKRLAGAGLIGRNWGEEPVLQASSFRLPSVSTRGEMRAC